MVASELTASARAMGMAPGQSDGTAPANTPVEPLQNRAGDSLSPFVRSLAGSPVAWQQLDNASVERAKKEHKLIFLHIGYKACYYCRLMAQESFSNPECASILSEHFIPIAVDRDERPDLDAIYMNYVQAVSSSGGWPLNLFLTPNLEPVFGGTYWPGQSSARRTATETGDDIPDFLDVVKKMRNIWRNHEARCRKEATDTVDQLKNFAAEGRLNTLGHAEPAPSSDLGAKTRPVVLGEVDLDQLEEAYAHIAGTFDPVYGGFGLAPKFVTPPKLIFLMHLSQFPQPVQDVVGESECAKALEMALTTLRQVRNSALRDHVGGTGFCRFSVTADWTVPNFEKLVVDNALLLSLYLEAWKVSGAKEDSEFFDVVTELADYLSSPPITLPDGAFASSEAAHSYAKKGDMDTQEGAYYLWTRREFDSIVETLGPNVSQVVAAHYGVQGGGNVNEAHDPNDDFINQNILCIRRTADDLSRHYGIPVSTVEEYIKSARSVLKERRDRDRPRPELDDKVVTGWNGLVISALAQTGTALAQLCPEKSARYIQAASKAAAFIRSQLWDKSSKTLSRIWRHGKSGEGFADDYAYLVLGLIDLFYATGDETILEFADIVQKTQISLFSDPEGGYYSTTASAPHTIIRLKDGMDTSLPSTNTVSVSNLFRLGQVLKDAKYTDLARETINVFEVEMIQHPWLFPGLLSGVVTARLGLDDKGAVDVKYATTREKA
ncbi:putative conserved protein YyaL, SSP411 family [Geosmithia morbida]|uniref:Conserved protein YyaL, SSP411 family n=1 Tax=Geosmithia morbida TaxID=1094350 RepID=A0A9P4Z0I2_9HYPO|nr:putative conserved protein YyaL, SSP411 family [Geosmithia morbida]KAF4124394.1 putative conserved protein YyaL, SSP411 family [Geosmithia morbida]